MDPCGVARDGSTRYFPPMALSGPVTPCSNKRLLCIVEKAEALPGGIFDNTSDHPWPDQCRIGKIQRRGVSPVTTSVFRIHQLSNRAILVSCVSNPFGEVRRGRFWSITPHVVASRPASPRACGRGLFIELSMVAWWNAVKELHSPIGVSTRSGIEIEFQLRLADLGAALCDNGSNEQSCRKGHHFMKLDHNPVLLLNG